MNFVHLHCHSNYSLLDGLQDIESIPKRAADLGMTAVALTDHGNLYGAYKFEKECKANGVKPIFGCEFYICSDITNRVRQRYHITVIAKNPTGLHNLVALSTKSYRDGFYYVPRIDLSLLTDHQEGLIVLSGCLYSELGQRLLVGYEPACDIATTYNAALEGYYLEIAALSKDDFSMRNIDIINMSDELNIPLVVTGDVHYTMPEEVDAHHFVTKLKRKDGGYRSEDIWFKGAQDIFNTFAIKWSGSGIRVNKIIEAMENTVKIADSVEEMSVHFDNDLTKLVDGDPTAKLRELVLSAYNEMFKDSTDYEQVYWNRLQRELEVIEELGFESVFLVCHMISEFAKRKSILMGPGRGSAPGSLVCYALGITSMDPIVHDLTFERFLLRGRVSLPDIDLDIERTGRPKIQEFLRSVLGEGHVTKIGTFSVMRDRGTVRDVARILIAEGTYPGLEKDVDLIAKQFPFRTGASTHRSRSFQQGEYWDSVKGDPLLARAYKRYPKLFDISGKMLGTPRHTGVHAAGVLLTHTDSQAVMPLARDDQKHDPVMPVTQWEMKDTEDAQLFKLDLLVLDSLDLIRECCEIAGIDTSVVHPKNLSPTDPVVLHRFQQGDTDGIFQFDKDYVKDSFKMIKADSFNDLIALNALLRPGAQKSNSTEEYADRKLGRKKGQYTLPQKAIECLKDTYGLILYQEQAMKIARECAGFTVPEADTLRKGIAKDYNTKELQGKFIDGCKNEGMEQEESSTLWQVLENAGGYMFNRAHSTCYSFIAYQMMWLKHNYPNEFWCASMNGALDDEEKFARMKRLATRSGLKIKRVDFKYSKAKCRYNPKWKAVHLGFLTLKGIGDKAAAELEKNNHHDTIEQWSMNITRRLVNKRVLEVLIQHKCFDSVAYREDEDWIIVKTAKPPKRGPQLSEFYEQQRLL